MTEPAPLLSARTATFTAGLQFAARASMAVMAVAITAIVTRAVSVDTYADWATALSVIGLFGFIMDPGISPVVVRRLVQRPETAPSVRAMLWMRAALALLAIALAVGVCTAIRGTGAALLSLVLAAQLLPRAIVLNGGALLQADHRAHRQAALEVGTTGVGLAALAALAAAGASAPVLALAGVTLPLGLLAVLVGRQASRTPAARAIRPGDDRARMRSIVREIAPLALAILLASLYTRIQVVFVNVAEDSRHVAEYLLAFQYVEQLFIVSSIIGATLLPFLADRARERVLHGDELTQDVLVGLAAGGACVAAVVLVLARPAIRILGGAKLIGGAGFLVLLAPMGTVLFVAVFLSYVYAAMGMGGRYLRFNVVGLVVALALNTAFTLNYGAAAAARVTWITEFCVVGLALVALRRSGAAGRATAARLAGLGIASAAAAEAVHAGALPGLVAAVLLVAAAWALGGGALRRLVTTRLRPGAAA
jgi:O-antigen/teichoic acid export membrane protein